MNQTPSISFLIKAQSCISIFILNMFTQITLALYLASLISIFKDNTGASSS